MESLVNWLREEQEVIRRAKLAVCLLLLLGGIAGWGASAFFWDRQVAETVAQAQTAQQAADAWRQRVEEISPEQARRLLPPPAAPRYYSNPLLTLAMAIVVGTVFLLVAFVPLQDRPKKGIRTESRSVRPDRPDPVKGSQLAISGGAAQLKQLQVGEGPLRFLEAGPAWREARPHVQVLLATADTHQRPSRGGQVRALIKLSNCTATDLSTCSIYVHSVRTDGRVQRVGRWVLKGPERKAHFPIKGNGTASFVLAFRNFNVAPDEPFQLNASNPDLSALSTPDHFNMADNSTHHLNLVIESGQGVVTRAVVEIEVGEYEELKVGLLGQSSWRPQR